MYVVLSHFVCPKVATSNRLNFGFHLKVSGKVEGMKDNLHFFFLVK